MIQKILRLHRYFILALATFLGMQGPSACGQKIGLVLSGGGARGMAHIGVIRALEENGIPIDCISGTSAGAVVGAFYAIGLNPDQIEALVLSEEFKEWATGKINENLDFYYNKEYPTASWVTLKFSLDSIIRTYIPSNVISSARSDFALMEGMSAAIAKANYNFDSLFVPFRCTAADINHKKQIIFKDGDLPLAVRASMSYPFYFSPVAIDNMILYDGGIYNNFPVDVMQSDFKPDVIIGVNTGSYPDIPFEENFFSMFKTMLIQSTSYTVPHEGDILITPDVYDVGVFEFDNMKAAIDSGYYATLRVIDSIKTKAGRLVDPDSVRKARAAFKAGTHDIYIDQIRATGINAKQEQYVRKILNYDNECLSIDEIKPSYFKLLTDKNIKSIFPRLRFNTKTGYYDMDLLIKKERDLRVDFGGNISSSPINEGFVGLHYNIWGKHALNTHANFYFGKLYNSIGVFFRYEFPTRFRFYVEPSVVVNRFDYYKSSTAFQDDIKPAYLVQSDRFYGINAGIPSRNKGKVIASIGSIKLANKYYQTRSFSNADISDITEMKGWMGSIQFDRNTLNKKMYANRGTSFNLSGKIITGSEETTPGTTGIFTDTIEKNQQWMQLRIIYDNYFSKAGPVTFGFYSDMFLSTQPFFANYTATILSSQAFQPTPQSQTVFLEDYRAHNYLGMGLKSIVMLIPSVELRLEGYMFQPFQEILEKPDKTAEYGTPFSTRSVIACLAGVYSSPVGPVSLSVNYFDKRTNPFTVLFHFGYIIFNKRVTE